jgi:hypothetical protein
VLGITTSGGWGLARRGRKEREGGTLAAFSKKRVPKPKKHPLADEVERLPYGRNCVVGLAHVS